MATVPGFGSPVITGATCLVPDFGAVVAFGAPVVQSETAVFMPGSRQVGYYVVAHRQIVPPGPAPAGLARSVVTGDGLNVPSTPRFVDPVCP